jgi:hypothetical protein
MANSHSDPAAAALARALCHTCPVRADCAGEALGYLEREGELYGCWAGVNVNMRSARTQLRRLASG